MATEQPNSFYTVDASGNTVPVDLTADAYVDQLKTSAIKARNRQNSFSLVGNSSINVDGIPGVPFEAGTPNPDLFYQGEDIVYDMFLYYDGAPVSLEKYNVVVSVKSSSRAYNASWQGFPYNGIYKMEGPDSAEGYYEIWIPSAITANLFAGTYYLHVQIEEKIGAGTGRFDRKYVALQTYFNLEYSNFSPAPESSSPYSTQAAQRAGMEATWPNKPSTVNRNLQQSPGGLPIQPNMDARILS